MPRVAIIGSGPTGLYTLAGLISSATPLSITIFEETPDAGKGTPYHPAVNDRAMLANIASIEIPRIEQTLVEWLSSQSDSELQELGVEKTAIGEREFYPRVVLGEFLAAQFWALVSRGLSRGHSIDVKASHRILDIKLGKDDISLKFKRHGGEDATMSFDHVVMATGHDWPENTETAPGYFVSPWPAAAIKRIGAVNVGVLGTSLSGIDAVVSVGTAHGMFLRDDNGTLRYEPRPASTGLNITMMSRKGLLPEADFYCPIPYEPLTYCTEEAVKLLIEQKGERLLDEVFELFRRELSVADPDYAASIGLALASVEDIADRYFRARQAADPFVWAAQNLAEAKKNKAERKTVRWRYAILRMHEVIALAIPQLNDRDLKRFHKHFKTVFVDDYATVPHESVERLLALHQQGKLSVKALGDVYDIRQDDKPGAVVIGDGNESKYDAFIDATGQHALSASDLPFPSLRQNGAIKEAKTVKAEASTNDETRRTGGIEIDDDFRPRVEAGLCNNLYCVSVPFLLHKMPFVQGITSAHEMGNTVAAAIIDAVANPDLLAHSR
ncbi:FAD/NAD(P)-binding protein [Rhizobium sp. S152]|uniref:FAD/NAD(P)-binding protein n=1 Tax=Rhizobium sp. S152 TaxID=3055038 RepID=UPI0025A9C261|nr:FAD/NAD(P)-binding protein [Rhizobium sp. S152]MDM9624559.1 FAD/NAD(P)-binding protein [Rhizobium sp. S152]